MYILAKFWAICESGMKKYRQTDGQTDKQMDMARLNLLVMLIKNISTL